MSVPSIRIDQPTPGVGTPGVSRDDLILTEVISFTDTANGSGTTWTLIGRPVGSTASIAGLGQTVTITPDVRGPYLVKATNAADISGTENAIGEFESTQGGAEIKLANGLSTITVNQTVQFSALHGWAARMDPHLRSSDRLQELLGQAEGTVWYANAAGEVAQLAPGTSGHFLKTLGAGNAPVWAAASITHSLDDAYDDGSTITADAGSVTINNAVDNSTACLQLTRTTTGGFGEDTLRASLAGSGTGSVIVATHNQTDLAGFETNACVWAADGTQLAPAFATTSDPTLGIYFPTGDIAFSLSDNTVARFGTSVAAFSLDYAVSLELREAGTVPGGAPAAGKGKIWVRNDVPNVLIFTDDVGTDTVLGSGGGTLDDAYDFGGAGAGRVVNVDLSLPVELRRNGVGETFTSSQIGLLLTNTTAATAGNEEWSPLLVLSGQAFDVTSKTGRWALQNQVGEPGDADIDPELHFLVDEGLGTFTSVYRLLESGGFVASGPSIVDGSIDLTTDLNMNGATSGALTQSVPAAVTTYIITWPSAQASGTRVLQNDGSGNLSWATAGAGGVTLDGAYDFGGAGVGRTINVTDGAVVLTNSDADATSNLEITKTPSGSVAGHGVDVTMGANATGHAVNITHSGSGIGVLSNAQIRGPVGTTAIASLAVGEVNTGIYLPSAGQIGMTHAGTLGFTMTATAAEAPTSAGDSAPQFTLAGSNNDGLRVTSSGWRLITGGSVYFRGDGTTITISRDLLPSDTSIDLGSTSSAFRSLFVDAVSLGTANTISGEFENSTAATAGSPQYSPVVQISGSAHDGAATRSHQFGLQVRGTDATTEGVLHWLYGTNAGALTSKMDLDESGNLHITGKLTVDGLIDPTGLVLDEQASVPGGTPAAGMAAIWVKNDTPNRLMFTDDAGGAFDLQASNGTYAFGDTLAIVTGTETQTFELGAATYAGSVIGISARVNTARTAGTITVALQVAGVTKLTATINATNTQTHRDIAAASTHAVNVGDRISVVVTATTFTPVTNELQFQAILANGEITSGGGDTVVFEGDLGSDGTTFDITGLDGDADGIYEIEAHIIINTANYVLTLEPNASSASLISRNWGNSTSAPFTTWNVQTNTVGTAPFDFTFHGTIKASRTLAGNTLNRSFWIIGHQTDSAGSPANNTFQSTGMLTSSASNLTSLRIACTQTMDANSWVVVRRKVGPAY